MLSAFKAVDPEETAIKAPVCPIWAAELSPVEESNEHWKVELSSFVIVNGSKDTVNETR